MIPKVIHYCWFGGNPLPELAQKCIASWKKYCPDYEIIEWNESNYDVTKNAYMYEAYQAKKWGFVPDYARLDIIYEHGGFYLDTDVELIKPLDGFLKNEALMGFEAGIYVSPGLIIGAVPKFPLIGELKDKIYTQRSFISADGSLDITPSPHMNTEELLKRGLRQDNSLQIVDGMTIFPTEYFCPMDVMGKELILSENTYSIHHYAGSWQSEELRNYRRYYNQMYPELKKILPDSAANLIARFIARARSFGVLQAMKKVRAYLKK